MLLNIRLKYTIFKINIYISSLALFFSTLHSIINLYVHICTEKFAKSVFLEKEANTTAQRYA